MASTRSWRIRRCAREVSTRFRFPATRVKPRSRASSATSRRWHSNGTNHSPRDCCLRQASDDAAEELAQRIRRDFGWPAFNLLERINHAQVRALEFDGIAQTLNERADHLQFVDRVFVWSRNYRGSDVAAASTGCTQPQAVFFLVAPRPDAA